jgi:phage-related protein
MATGLLKPLHWTGSSKKDLLAMPAAVVDVFGYALFLAQAGSKHPQAKPLRGFGGASVLEVVETREGGSYRAVYWVKLGDAVYVLHCFQKKSTLENAEMIDIKKGSTNVYADLGLADAAGMLVKARLAAKIAEIIKQRRLTQVRAAAIIGMPQPKLSGMLRGRFRGISETKMLQCLNRLGRDVDIVVRERSRVGASGRTRVVFAA